MITSTQGIVISYIKYGESSIIVKIFTENYGYQSFIVSGVRSKKSRNSIGIYQSFNILELNIYYNPNKDLHRINDAKISFVTPSLQLDQRKSAITIFLSEILSKVLFHENSQNKPLFEFIKNSIVIFDGTIEHFESFHVHFLLNLSTYLGIGIHNRDVIIDKTISKNEKLSQYITSLLASNSFSEITSNSQTRYDALVAIVDYYMNHIGNHIEIKSLKILHRIFH